MRIRLAAAAILLLLPTVRLAADEGRSTTTEVVDVEVKGARRYPAERVLNMVRTRKGHPYRPDILREDVKMLDGQGWYYSVVSEEQERPDGVAIIFRVIERPTIQDIVYEGAKHFSKDELEKFTGLRRGGPLSPALNRRAARSIEQAYQEKSRLLASVELVEGGSDEDVRVVFRISEGPIVRIRGFQFEGVTGNFVSAARLRSKLQSSARFLGMGGKYNPLMLDDDVAKITEYYRAFGFFDVKVRRKLVWNEGQESVDVVFVIDEGVRYLVRNSELAGNSKIPTEKILAKNQLKSGEPFKAHVMQASARQMGDVYGSQGYVSTKVTPEFRFEEQPGTVDVVYQVTEGQPHRIGTVDIIGNTQTRDRVIRRQGLFVADGQIPVAPGNVLDTTAVRTFERNLDRLGIFTDPQRGIHPTVTIADIDGDQEFKNLIVQVEEQRTGSLLFGASVNSDAGLIGNIVFNERNFDITRLPTSWDDVWENRAFRGAGQEFRVELTPGTQLSRAIVSWREPYLLDTPYSLGLSGYYYTRRFHEYDEQRTGTNVTVGHRFTPEWSGSIAMRAEDVKVSNFAAFAPADFQEVGGHNTVLAPRIGVTRDTRDSFIRPTEGNLFEAAYEQGLGDFVYPKLTLEDSQFFTVPNTERADGSGRHVIAVKGQVGVAGSSTPLYDRFYAGGFKTLRGFAFRGVGPDISDFKVGGDFLAIGSVEYQIPLMANDFVYAVLFSDFGTVEKDVGFHDFRMSVGAGLRLVVPMFGPVPIALDFGFPLMKKDTDEREVFSFFVGFTH